MQRTRPSCSLCIDLGVQATSQHMGAGKGVWQSTGPFKDRSSEDPSSRQGEDGDLQAPSASPLWVWQEASELPDLGRNPPSGAHQLCVFGQVTVPL